MAHKRKNDPKVQAWYRTDRMVEDNEKWFFHTREGTIEGPFESRLQAESQLETYIKLQDSGLLSDNDQPSDQLELKKH